MTAPGLIAARSRRRMALNDLNDLNDRGESASAPGIEAGSFLASARGAGSQRVSPVSRCKSPL